MSPGDQVVDEHTESAPRAGTELLDDPDEIVDAAEVFDDDAFHPQVVAPHLFDEFGVLTSLDVDAAGHRRSGRRRTGTEPDAARAGAFGVGRRGAVRMTGLPSIRYPGR